MTRRRVVVTGLGCISPVGNTVADAWANLLAGQSGIGHISKFDTSAFSCRIAGEVKGFNLEQYISAKEARTMDTFIHFGIAAAVQAVEDAGLPLGEALDDELATRIACVIGSGIGGLPMIEQTHVEYTARGPRRISPFFVPASIINMIAGHVSMRFGFKGPNLAIVTACTTGLHCIGEASRMIEYGDADVVVAGGSEATISPLGLGVLQPCAPCPLATTIQLRPHVPGTKTEMVLCSEKAPASWSSKSTNTLKRVVPKFMQKYAATA